MTVTVGEHILMYFQIPLFETIQLSPETYLFIFRGPNERRVMEPNPPRKCGCCKVDRKCGITASAIVTLLLLILLLIGVFVSRHIGVQILYHANDLGDESNSGALRGWIEANKELHKQDKRLRLRRICWDEKCHSVVGFYVNAGKMNETEDASNGFGKVDEVYFVQGGNAMNAWNSLGLATHLFSVPESESVGLETKGFFAVDFPGYGNNKIASPSVANHRWQIKELLRKLDNGEMYAQEANNLKWEGAAIHKIGGDEKWKQVRLSGFGYSLGCAGVLQANRALMEQNRAMEKVILCRPFYAMTKWLWNYQWLSWIVFSGAHAWDNAEVAREMNEFAGKAEVTDTPKKYEPQVVILGDYSDSVNDWRGQVALLNEFERATMRYAGAYDHHWLHWADLNRTKESVWDLKYGTFHRSTDSIMLMSGKDSGVDWGKPAEFVANEPRWKAFQNGTKGGYESSSRWNEKIQRKPDVKQKTGVFALLDTELQHNLTLEQEPEFRNLENTDGLIRSVERLYLFDKEREMQRPEF